MNGNQLKISIKEKGLTQQKAAEILGVSRQTFNSWCKSISLPEDTIRNIKTLLGVNVEIGEGEMLKKSGKSLENSSNDSTFVLNRFVGFSELQVEQDIENTLTRKLLEMYECGLIVSSAATVEFQKRIGELLTENAKLQSEIDALRRKLDKPSSRVCTNQETTKSKD